MKAWWEKLTVKQRQIIQYGGVIAGLMVMVVVFLKPDENFQRQRQKPSKTLLTDANARELSQDQMQAELRRIQQENSNLTKEMQAIRAQNASLASKSGVGRDDLERLRLEFSEEMAKQVQALQAQTPILTNPEEPRPPSAKRTGSSGSADPFAIGDAPVAPQNLKPAFSGAPRPTANQAPGQVQPPTSQGQAGSGTPEFGGRIRVISPAADQSSKAPDPKATQTAADKATSDNPLAEEARTFIPAGSIIRGLLLTGMDAPTAKNARSDPYPALIRITDDAILPNYNFADIRECFVVAAGYGDLSSERLMLRSETLSCVTNSGGVIEVPIKAYAVGDDGKTGMRGRLVNKQASLIAKAMLAGALEGFSNIFRQAAVPTLNTVANPQAQFQSLVSAESTESAAASGAGRALERLADYYMSLADSVHPVIEVDAGRVVDLVVSSGVSIRALDS